MRRFVITLMPLLWAVPAWAQQPTYPTRFSPAVTESPAVRDALTYVDQHFDAQVAEWIRITEMPAKSEHEERRAAYVKAQLEALGLPVTVDSIGNVSTRLRGTGGGPTLVFAAHLDTVHPMETDVTVTRRGDRLHAPGVFDNSASVANALQAVRALLASGVRPKGDVVFVWTVQEELGLRGMAYWLDHNPNVADMLVALDGGLGSVSYGALGIYWSRMVFTGEGAHTNNSRGRPHPARAAARCIQDIYQIPLPPPGAPVSAVYNVGMWRGGHVVNAIPQEISFTVDLRTVDPALLAQLDTATVNTCRRAAEAEKVGFEREFIQKNEAGGRPEQLADRRAHPLVQTAVDVLRYLGVELPAGREASPSGSTDSNVGVVRGIPSISVGRSRGGDQHTLSEWADVPSANIGTKQIILLTATMAELEGRPTP
jgi:acetylornithine deacetylase/succinyl-diaminopimelate desuccinylase-like protein